MSVFKAMNAVQQELSAVGIGKTETNEFDRYKFRGIDALLNTVGPILANHGLIVIPHVEDREIRQVQTAKGGTMNHVILRVTYHFYNIEGETVAHTVDGEGMDRGDKAINKALTSAFKNMLFQAFSIPLQGQDTETDSPEMVPAYTKEQKQQLTALLASQDGVGLHAFYSNVGQDVMDALFNSAPHGQKTAFKNDVRKLYATANDYRKKAIAAIQTAIVDGAGATIEEVFHEMTDAERSFVKAGLTEVELHQIQQLTEAA